MVDDGLDYDKMPVSDYSSPFDLEMGLNKPSIALTH